MDRDDAKSSTPPTAEPETSDVAAEPAAPWMAPWISAAIAGGVLIALVLVYLLILRPDEREADRQRAAARKHSGQLTATETRAVDAAATEMINLVSFRRDHFEADFKRALDGAYGPLRTDVGKNRAATLETMTKGKFDLYGRLTHKALEGPIESGKKKGYVVLVTINGYRSSTPDAAVQQNLEVTVLDINGKWLAADVTNIGITG